MRCRSTCWSPRSPKAAWRSARSTAIGSSARCTASPTRDADVLHSHYMAVDPEYRRLGLGVELKQRQRAWCLDRGHHATCAGRTTRCSSATRTSTCTCSAPSGVAYHVDHYGHLGGINGSLPSDRITVSWELEPASPKPQPTVVVDVPPVTADDIAASSNAALQARLFVRDELAPTEWARAGPSSTSTAPPAATPRPHLTGRLVHSNVRSVPVLRPPPPLVVSVGRERGYPRSC